MKEKKRKKIAVLFQCGFEYRSTLLSGLILELQENYEVIGFSRKCDSRYLKEYFHNYKINYIEFEDEVVEKNRSIIENYNLAARKARFRLLGIDNFNYFNEDRKIKVTDYVLGNKVIYKLFQYLARKINHVHYSSKRVQKLFKEHHVTDFILCGYMGTGAISFALNAKKLDINVWLIMNNWKNIYVNNFIPFRPKKIFTWNQQMSHKYSLLNTHIEKDNFIVSGNTVFDRFYNYKPCKNRIFYEKKYGFLNTQPILLYTMLSPEAYTNELESILLIDKLLDKIYTDPKTKPFLLLRRNPLDKINKLKIQENENVVYAENYYDDHSGKELMIQSEEGENEWMDLIFHSEILLNVASTVTLEALMLNTPVINIEFNGEGTTDKELKRFTNAPFYSSLKENKNIAICETILDMENSLKKFLNDKKKTIKIPGVVGPFDGNATKRIVEEIN